jgi:hypothetical protein
MRAQVELYKLHHKGIAPGYVSGAEADVDTLELQLTATSADTGATSVNKVRIAPFLFGPYVKKIPSNPFNNRNTIKYVAVADDMAAAAEGTSSGWLYKRETGEIRVNYPGKDSNGMTYTDY